MRMRRTMITQIFLHFGCQLSIQINQCHYGLIYLEERVINIFNNVNKKLINFYDHLEGRRVITRQTHCIDPPA